MKTVNLVLFIITVLGVIGNAESLGQNLIYDISWVFQIFVATAFWVNYKNYKKV
jgi:hypothetical protein